MRKLPPVFALVGMLIFAPGCATRTILLDTSADVVRLGPGCVGRVYVLQGGEWKLSGKTKLPEGWYAGPGPL